jgi:hypothetical protein
LTIGQVKSDAKSTEKTAILELLDDLDLKNVMISVDAIACNNPIANQIIEEGGYAMAVKKNKKGLYEEISHWRKRDRGDFGRKEGRSIKQRGLKAGWDNDYLIEILETAFW